MDQTEGEKKKDEVFKNICWLAVKSSKTFRSLKTWPVSSLLNNISNKICVSLHGTRLEYKGKEPGKISCILDLHTCALVTHVLAMHKAAIGRSAQSSPAPDSFPIWTKSASLERTGHACLLRLQRRKDMQPPATGVGNTQLMHLSTSDTYHRLALSNNLA